MARKSFQELLSRAEIASRSERFLKAIQQELMPEHADAVVAINLETGEYVLGSTPDEADQAFRARWPHTLMFRCRVDGGPVAKFHGAAPL